MGQFQYESAAMYYQKHYDQLPLDSFDLRGRAAFMVGRSLSRIGHLEESLSFFERSVEYFELAQNTPNEWVARGSVFRTLDDMGRYQEAIEMGERSVQFYRSIKDTLDLGKVLINVSLAYYKNGQTDAAVERLLESATLTKGKFPQTAAIAYNQLGTIWAEDLNDESRALYYYKKSLALKTGTDNPGSLSSSYNNIGISYKNLNMPDSAFFYYEKALKYGYESGRANRILDPLINLGNLHQNQGNTGQAIHYYLKAYEMRDYLSHPQKLATFLALGKMYYKQGSTNQSIVYLEEGLALTEQAKDLKWQLDFLPDLASTYAQQNDFEKAYLYQARFSNLIDSFTLQEKNDLIADLLVQYETAEKELALFETEAQLNRKEIQLKNRTLSMLSVLLLVIVVSGISFVLYRQKKAAEKQAILQLRLSEQKAVNKIQEDRLNISRELHDNIGAQLTFVNAGLEQFLYSENPPSKSQLKLLKENLTQSMRELRKTVWLINKTSASIDEVALKLRDVFKPVHQNGRLVQVLAEGNTTQKLNEVQTTHLFRIVQEAVNNAVKYSGCKKLHIHLMADNDRLQLVIEDDGSGFDPEKIKYGNGFKNLEYRAKELNGSITVKPDIGVGTRIEVSIPIDIS